MTDPILSLDLAAAGITSIVWATGYALDFGWLKVDAFDENGRPRHQRGVSAEPGIYFLGLPWQSRRGSSFIWGVWHDAKFVADHIAIQRSYLAYAPAAARRERQQHAEGSQMAHTRIRKFNTKDTYPEQKLDNDLCQAVVRARHDDLPARPVPAGSRHREEHRQPRPGRADPQGDAEHPPADRGVRREDGAPRARSSST